ncbi:MAG: hypothetical protein GX124_06585 [Clostridiales bacterium]|jgi:metal-responsive CopG/Arc/MetJ family transcriptional regulator|nr:hypothetical protein [Clostridiales bacterium]
MAHETIMAIRTDTRRDNAEALQKVLTEYGCNIKLRLGLHEAGDRCSDSGLILLVLTGPQEEIARFEEALQQVAGVQYKTMAV